MASPEPELGQPAFRTPSPPRDWRAILFIVVAASVSGLVLCAALLWVPTISPAYVERHDYGSVAKAFFRALLKGDYQAATSLTIAEQRPRLAEWMSARQPFECPFLLTLDEMEGEVYGAVGVRSEGSAEASYSWSYACTHEDYTFTVDDIVLVLSSEGEWAVLSWKVCEERRETPKTCDDFERT